MRTIWAGLLLSSATLEATPLAAQDLLEPTWEIREHRVGCELFAKIPQSASIDRVYFGYFNREEPLSRVTVHLAEEATSGPKDALLGINGNPPVTAALRFYPGMSGYFASFSPSPDLDLSEAIAGGADGVLRLGSEVISMRALGENYRRVMECGKRTFSAMQFDQDRYPVTLNLLDLPSDAPSSVKEMGHDIVSVIGPQDYPQRALRLKEQGTVRVILFLNPMGRVDECLVAKSASELIDEATCGALRSRVRVEPVRDEGGNPVGAVILPPPLSWSIPSF